MSEECDILIVGAGAAGMAAGIFAGQAGAAAERKPRIVVLEGAKTIGAKILVSGGARCNVTHDRITPDDFNGARNIVRNILAAFNENAAVQWMADLGVELKREETGKLFPVSDSAKTVLSALLARLEALGAAVRIGCRVTEVSPLIPSPGTPGDGMNRFLVRHTFGQITASRVILCTGGKSLPRTGSDGGGWAIAKTLGHSITETWPALVPLVLSPAMFHAEVSGLSHEAELSTFVDGKLVDRRSGSMLWTHFGISGPVVMDASRFWTSARGRGQTPELRCGFLPERTFDEVEREWMQRSKARPKLSVGKAVNEFLPERLATALARYLNIDPASTLSQLSREHRRALVHGLTALPLPVERDRGWNYAEVTAGGVPLAEIDFRTMASRKTPGLVLAGEMLDCDGRIGGFNFQWAWATGYLAGRGAAAGLP